MSDKAVQCSLLILNNYLTISLQKGCKGLSIIVMLSLWLLSGCSQYSSRPLSVGYHNVTSRYNAYYIARADIDSVELAVSKEFKENYLGLLPVLPPIDTLITLKHKPLLEDAVKKASVVAEKHQNSRWLDNSYTLLGKARLYMGEWDDAVEAFRYVFANGKDENDKNEALTWLMRAYIDHMDYTNALNVAEYLRLQPLSKQTTKDYYLAKAYLHQQRKEYLLAVAILEESLPLMKKSAAKSRIHYVMGQLYDELGKYQLANKQYNKADNNKASYELGFFARLNSIQNKVILNPKTELTSLGLGRMLRDRKNIDLKDRIYFTMGMLAEHQGNNQSALAYLQQAVANGKANIGQIPYTYLEMARIHNDRLGNFELSKMYYDSALAALPQGSPDFKAWTERKKALDEFVQQMAVLKREDSLQRLAGLSPESMLRKLDDVIAAEEAEKAKRIEMAKSKEQNEQVLAAQPGSMPTGRRWALYDPNLVSRGKMEFKRIWGNRILEDNWRLTNKQTTAFNNTANNNNNKLLSAVDTTLAQSEKKPENSAMEKGSSAWIARRDLLKSEIPLTDSLMRLSHKRKENALYELGKIYRFDLKESKNALSVFNRLLNEYPNTTYREEVYYLLFLTLPDTDKGRMIWKDKLIAEFPGSTYARLLSNFDDANLSSMDAGEAEKVYQSIYKLYSSGNHTQALSEIENALTKYQRSLLKDKFALLRIYLVGKVRGRDAYLQAINEFIRLYPDSKLLPRVQEMLEITGQASLRGRF